MRQLSPAGQQAVNDIAQRHGFSPDAVASMLGSVIDGNGSMAQFNHPEFAGSGQWMRGGMIMLSDMFNNYLKGRVDGLCTELSNLVANQPDLIRTGSFQSQSQGGQYQGGPYQNSQYQGSQGGGGMEAGFGAASLFVPPPPGQGANWWPADLGFASSTGAQNDVRYAYFADSRRLAIATGGHVTVYDTLDHNIGGFSQQQSYGGSLSFTSQYGLVDVAGLPVVSIDGQAPPAPPQPVYAPPVYAPPVSMPPAFESPAPAPAAEGDIFAAIEKLAALHAKGILTDQEFGAKKAELLSRL
ncbi:MAG: SHOCT domain-containing protein [Zavarzinia sp.]|nr:SHOCT domain-containing protein [Zavarzinia sp.]